MSKLRRFRVGILLAVALVGVCALVYAGTTAPNYAPMKVGDWLRFAGSADEYYQFISSYTDPKSGHTIYLVKITSTAPTVYWHFWKVGKDLYSEAVGSPYACLEIKYPLTGVKWVAQSTPYMTAYRQILSFSKKIAVTAGIFKNCLEIRQTDTYKQAKGQPPIPPMIFTYWYAPNQGMVAMTCYRNGKLIANEGLTASKVG